MPARKSDKPSKKQPYKAVIDIGLKYRAVVDAALDAILLSKADGTVLEVNRAACEMFGYTEKEFKKLKRPDFIDAGDGALRRILKERSEKGWSRGELTGIRKNGERFPVEFSTVQI
ncbi:MAG TPA: PAS domain-containing protein, partial [Chitinophagaceae bacterium]|nr:PAS domain-containing protein [Chitinophagaceae bacterium]